MEQNEQNKLPLKKIIISSIMVAVLAFSLVLILAVLTSNQVISIKLGAILTYPCIFLAGLLGFFFLAGSKKALVCNLISAICAYLAIWSVSMLLPYNFSGKNAIYVLIILVLSAIINSIIRAIK